MKRRTRPGLQSKRKVALQTQISEARRKKDSLELIVGTDKRHRERLAGELDRVGRVTQVYRHIPYVSAIVEAEDAELMQRYVTNWSGAKFEFLKLIRSLDISSTMTATPTKIRRVALDEPLLWNLSEIGAYAAQAVSRGSGTKVGIIDTGADGEHPELKGKLAHFEDLIGGQARTYDDNGHGTHIAGITLGSKVGVAPESKLISIKALDKSGSGPESAIIRGIEIAVDKGAHVINMSLGSSLASEAFEDACYFAYERGVYLVAAAGNGGDQRPKFPAAFGEPVIAVAAVDRDKKHASFSNIYPTNDISSPGVGIKSAYLNGSYALLDGTSMAAPHASGALLIGSAALGAGSLDSIMEKTAEELHSNLPYSDRAVFGAGLLRVDKMISGAERILKRKARRKPSLTQRIWRIIW